MRAILVSWMRARRQLSGARLFESGALERPRLKHHWWRAGSSSACPGGVRPALRHARHAILRRRAVPRLRGRRRPEPLRTLAFERMAQMRGEFRGRFNLSLIDGQVRATIDRQRGRALWDQRQGLNAGARGDSHDRPHPLTRPHGLTPFPIDLENFAWQQDDPLPHDGPVKGRTLTVLARLSDRRREERG